MIEDKVKRGREKKKKKGKRRSEMTKTPLAINRRSKLSYYLETQIDGGFGRGGNALTVCRDNSLVFAH